jgi:hypothetical protein
MTDTTTSTRPIVIRSKLTYSDLAGGSGGVKKIDLDAAPNHRAVVGIIHGFCNDIIVRSAPDGSDKKYTGLSGSFEGIPINDLTLPVLQSSILFLPDAFRDQIIAVLKQQAGADGKGVVIGCEFAFKFSVFQAKNPQGYSWEAEIIGDIVSKDPMERTRKLIAGMMRPSLPAPDNTSEHDPASVMQAATSPKAVSSGKHKAA